MSDHNDKSLDILGVKPVAEALSHATKAGIDGASSFLAKICMPAAEEFGYLLQDKVKNWRAQNTAAILNAAQDRLTGAPQGVHAHPRLVAAVLENGSWSDDRAIQQFWGGLLAASCSEDGSDDGNIIFAKLLGQLTSLQAHVLAHACHTCKKSLSHLGLLTPDGSLVIELNVLMSISQSSDVHRLDRELDNLRDLGLIHGGILLGSAEIDLTPTSLALNLYARCHGHKGPPGDFFGVKAAA
jgi:hypothetical protein